MFDYGLELNSAGQWPPTGPEFPSLEPRHKPTSESPEVFFPVQLMHLFDRFAICFDL